MGSIDPRWARTEAREPNPACESTIDPFVALGRRWGYYLPAGPAFLHLIWVLPEARLPLYSDEARNRFTAPWRFSSTVNCCVAATPVFAESSQRCFSSFDRHGEVSLDRRLIGLGFSVALSIPSDRIPRALKSAADRADEMCRACRTRRRDWALDWAVARLEDAHGAVRLTLAEPFPE